jgi:hypothetical protein
VRTCRILLIAACLGCAFLSACTTIRDGVVIEKRSRLGLAEVYGEDFDFRCEPTIYWVRVEGRDDKGRERIKNVILFRNDWLQLRVGDRWSRKGGFSPGEAGK